MGLEFLFVSHLDLLIRDADVGAQEVHDDDHPQPHPIVLFQPQSHLCFFDGEFLVWVEQNHTPLVVSATTHTMSPTSMMTKGVSLCL